MHAPSIPISGFASLRYVTTALCDHLQCYLKLVGLLWDLEGPVGIFGGPVETSGEHLGLCLGLLGL